MSAYEMLPIFSPSTSVPASVAQSLNHRSISTKPPAIEPGLFMPSLPWRELPRAAFPSLTIQGRRSAAAGLSGGGQAAFDYGASNQGLEELQLFDVVTYGLPSARASAALLRYCSDEKTKGDCLETTARKHLQSIVGSRINNKYLDTDGDYQFEVKVGIVMVNRVYLTRSILHLRRSGSTQAGGARVTGPSPNVTYEKTAKEPPEQSPPTSHVAGTNSPDSAAMTKSSQ